MTVKTAKPATPAAVPEKGKCPISRDDFMSKALPVSVKIGDTLISAGAKEFSTGSFGFFMNGKVTLEINGIPIVFQLTGSLIAVGSKPKE